MVYRLIRIVGNDRHVQYGRNGVHHCPAFIPLSEAFVFENSITIHKKIETALEGKLRFIRDSQYTETIEIEFAKKEDGPWFKVVEGDIFEKSVKTLEKI